MKPNALIAFICGMNLMGILVELSLVTLFVVPLGSDARFNLRNSISTIDVMLAILYPLTLCLTGVTFIDFKLDYSNKLHHEESIAYPKALRLSGIPNLTTKILALACINWRWLPSVGLASGAIVVGVYGLGLIPPFRKWLAWIFGSPSFGPLQDIIHVACRTAIVMFCAIPFWSVTVNWLMNHAMSIGRRYLQVDQLVLCSSFSIPTIIMLLRLIYTPNHSIRPEL